MIKQIERMSRNLKAEAITAASKIELDGYTVDFDTITCDEDGDFWPIYFYRNGDEVIAVADFYIGEEGVVLHGSKGGEYELNGEEVTMC